MYQWKKTEPPKGRVESYTVTIKGKEVVKSKFIPHKIWSWTNEGYLGVSYCDSGGKWIGCKPDVWCEILPPPEPLDIKAREDYLMKKREIFKGIKR